MNRWTCVLLALPLGGCGLVKEHQAQVAADRARGAYEEDLARRQVEVRREEALAAERKAPVYVYRPVRRDAPAQPTIRYRTYLAQLSDQQLRDELERLAELNSGSSQHPQAERLYLLASVERERRGLPH